MAAASGARTGKGFLLFLPFLLFFIALIFLSQYLYENVLEETSYFRLLIGAETDAESDAPADVFVPRLNAPDPFPRVPSIAYGAQWAILNVSWDGGGWSLRDIPVYLGSDKQLLKKGAGMSFGSAFPGEGKRTILSAHVTRHFAQLEDTPAGAVVTLQTSYGVYTYRVADRQTFEGTDRTYLSAADRNELVLATCYPRDNGGHRRTQRLVLLCEKTGGKEVD